MNAAWPLSQHSIGGLASDAEVSKQHAVDAKLLEIEGAHATKQRGHSELRTGREAKGVAATSHLFTLDRRKDLACNELIGGFVHRIAHGSRTAGNPDGPTAGLQIRERKGPRILHATRCLAREQLIETFCDRTSHCHVSLDTDPRSPSTGELTQPHGIDLQVRDPILAFGAAVVGSAHRVLEYVKNANCINTLTRTWHGAAIRFRWMQVRRQHCRRCHS